MFLFIGLCSAATENVPFLCAHYVIFICPFSGSTEIIVLAVSVH